MVVLNQSPSKSQTYANSVGEATGFKIVAKNEVPIGVATGSIC